MVHAVWVRELVVSGGFFLFVFMVCFSGCMTPERAVRESEDSATNLVSRYMGDVFEEPRRFTISKPAEALTLRLTLQAAAEGREDIMPLLQATTGREFSGVAGTNVVTFSLEDALAIGATNDRQYQSLKETVFLRALDLDQELYGFETTFSGMMLAAMERDQNRNFFSSNQIDGRGSFGFQRKFQNGATLAGTLALDVVQLLRNDWRSVGLLGDLSLSVPLLRGSGRDVVLEPLRQADRNLLDALNNFAHYRQTYAVSVVNGYLGVLEARQRVENAKNTAKRLERNKNRAEALRRAERMDPIQADQATQDYLSAEENVVANERSYANALDSFRMTLGLPPESPFDVDPDVLVKLRGDLEVRMDKIQAGELATVYDEREVCELGLLRRHDYRISLGGVADAERKITVREDALRADLTLNVGVSGGRDRETGGSWSGDESWYARLRADLPWNRRAERNAYRAALITLDRAKRDLTLKEDQIRQSLRADLRNIEAARSSFAIQREAVALAQRRVNSTEMYMEAGRSQMRDLLEAQSALLSAQNSYLSAVVTWQMRELELRRDTAMLDVDDFGLFDIYGSL